MPRERPLNVPITFKVDAYTARAIREQAGDLHTGQFVRMVLKDALKLRAAARSQRFEALVRPSPRRSRLVD